MTQIPTSALKIVEWLRENVPRPTIPVFLSKETRKSYLWDYLYGAVDRYDFGAEAHYEFFDVWLWDRDAIAAIDLIWGRKEG